MALIRSLAALLFVALWGTACAVPSLHGIAEEATLEFDASLLGDWFDSDGTRFAVVQAAEGRYAVTIHPPDEEPLGFTVALTRVGGSRVLDVTLGEAAAERLGERYGPFVVTTHHLYRLEAGESGLVLQALDPDWLEDTSGYDENVGAMGLLISQPAQLLWLVEQALATEDAWMETTELSRRGG